MAAKCTRDTKTSPEHLAQSSPYGVLLAALLAPPPAPAAEPAFPSDTAPDILTLDSRQHASTVTIRRPAIVLYPCYVDYPAMEAVPLGPRAVSSLYTRYARARREHTGDARHETARTAAPRGDTLTIPIPSTHTRMA